MAGFGTGSGGLQRLFWPDPSAYLSFRVGEMHIHRLVPAVVTAARVDPVPGSRPDRKPPTGSPHHPREAAMTSRPDFCAQDPWDTATVSRPAPCVQDPRDATTADPASANSMAAVRPARPMNSLFDMRKLLEMHRGPTLGYAGGHRAREDQVAKPRFRPPARLCRTGSRAARLRTRRG